MQRCKKYIHLTEEFFRRAIERKLFKSVELATKEAINAVKWNGVIQEDYRKANKQFCIFRNSLGIIVTLPIVEYDKAFVITTVFEADEWQKSVFKSSEQKIKRKGKNDK